MWICVQKYATIAMRAPTILDNERTHLFLSVKPFMNCSVWKKRKKAKKKYNNNKIIINIYINSLTQYIIKIIKIIEQAMNSEYQRNVIGITVHADLVVFRIVVVFVVLWLLLYVFVSLYILCMYIIILGVRLEIYWALSLIYLNVKCSSL